MTLMINPILCRKGTMNNYAYLIADKKNNIYAIVDASEAEPIVEYCEKNSIRPQYILTTHHHFDHVEGNRFLKDKYGLKIIAPELEKDLIVDADILVKDGDELKIGDSVCRVISAPGHTKGHVLWYFENEKILFTGDILFNLCIGGLFEGTPEEMYNSLAKIKSLPDDVNFYPGHEYTQHCLQYVINSDNSDAQEYFSIAMERLKKDIPVAPISLKLEKKCNPYLKINDLRNFSRLF